MNLQQRTGSTGKAGFLKTAVLLALFVGAAALFASLMAQDAEARGSSSSSGSKSSSASSSNSKAGASSGSKSKSGSSSSSGVKYKAHKDKDFDCDEDDGCFEDEQAGQSDGGVMGWLVAVFVLGMVGVVGVGTAGYVGWRFYRGLSLRGDRQIR